MLRERDGPPSPMLLGLAGLAMGYAFTSEYPPFFAAIVLGLYPALAPGRAQPAGGRCAAAAPTCAGGLVGIVPLLLYNHYAFHSWTHLAYSDVPRQQKGFFGIGAPSLKVLSTLLFDSRGLLTLSPVLIDGRDRHGAALPARQARRGAHDRRHLPLLSSATTRATTCPSAAASWARASSTRCCRSSPSRSRSTLKRFPGPTIALAAISITTIVIATITHPLVGYENETVVWVRYLLERPLPADDRLRLRPRPRLGRDLAVLARRRRRRSLAGRMGDAAPAPRHRRRWAGACSRSSAGRCSRRSRRPCSGSTTPACRASTKPATTPPST